MGCINSFVYLLSYSQVVLPHPPLSGSPRFSTDRNAEREREPVQPSLTDSRLTHLLPPLKLEAEFSLKDPKQDISPTQLTWSPLPIPSDNSKVTFIDGIATILGNGGPMAREGLAIHLYSANASMEKTAFVNSDGDFLIVPTEGRLDVQTELGK